MKIIDVLEKQFIKEFDGIEKDKMEDQFDYWLQNLELGDVLDYEI